MAERQQGADAVLADRERHRPERADRREPHDDADDAEQHVGGFIQHLDERPTLLAELGERQAEQHGEQQHLHNLPFRERADGRVGDDVHQVIDRVQVLGLRRIGLYRLGVEAGRIGIDAGSGPIEIGDHETDEEGDRGQHLEIDQRLQSDAPDLLQIAHLGNTDRDSSEDDRGDHHLDQLDERVSQRLELRGEVRNEEAQDNAERYSHDDLKIK